MYWTIQEWIDYIQSLDGEELLSKAIAANSIRFVQQLQDKGMDAEEIDRIFVEFANQFSRTGQAPPRSGFVDYAGLASAS